jgi:hypothetical protein
MPFSGIAWRAAEPLALGGRGAVITLEADYLTTAQILGCSRGDQHQRARLSQILDLLAEDNRLNVYGGELEVRPPGAPTIQPLLGDSGGSLR